MNMVPEDSKQRFSNRVTDYVSARPSYPKSLLDLLSAKIGFDSSWTVLDVGAGTGISSKLFLDNGNAVVAAEPNDAMRTAAEQWLANYPKYRSINSPAESIPLEDHSLNLIIAAQAFHWFDPVQFAKECRRLLNDRGSVAIIWNTFEHDSTPAAVEYHGILRSYSLDFEKIVNKWRQSDLLAQTWFTQESYSYSELRNDQTYDFDQMIARVASSSYMPSRDHPRFESMVDAYRKFHAEFASDGRVTLPCVCKVYLGRPREEIK